VQNLVYHAHAGDVGMVMVDGRVLLEGGQPTQVDRAEVIDAARRSSAAVWRRFEAKYGGPIAEA